MKTISLEQIDRSTHEGRLLWAALIELTTTVHTDKTPYEVIELLYKVADNSDAGNKEANWPARARSNVYAQIDELQNFFIREMPRAIMEGGAIENAIALLKKAYLGLEFGKNKKMVRTDSCVSSTPFADAIKKQVNEDEQHKQAGLFEIQNAGEIILSKAVCLPSVEYKEIERLLVGLYRIISGR